MSWYFYTLWNDHHDKSSYQLSSYKVTIKYHWLYFLCHTLHLHDLCCNWKFVVLILELLKFELLILLPFFSHPLTSLPLSGNHEIVLSLFIFLATPGSMHDVSSLTRVQTYAPCISPVLATGLSLKSPDCSLYLWVCFSFVVFFHCFLDSTYKWIHAILVFLYLISFHVISSRSIHVVANGKLLVLFYHSVIFQLWHI